MKSFFTFFFLFHSLFLANTFSQEQTSVLKGSVENEKGQPITGAVIQIEGHNAGGVTDSNGTYIIARVPDGNQTVTVHYIGYEPVSKKVNISTHQTIPVNFRLVEKDVSIQSVLVTGKSLIQEVKEQSYNVSVVNAEALHNTTLDISQALERASGVRVRRTGGVGSDANIMLNGFTGRHVKIFMDGVPMEGFNSAFQLNNLPVNLAKRIEVYKGVVPIQLGSDALGGAINIVTEDENLNFLDASYSFSSFNTHKSFLNAAYTAESGFTARLTAFQNYSDNDYNVDVDIVDLENSRFTGDIRNVPRFHDAYENYSVIGKMGVVNKGYADQLLVGFTWGDEFDEIQHPAYMKLAFGEKYMKSETLMPSLSYKKKNLLTKGLQASFTANYNFGQSANIDDSYRRYNWLGEYIETDAPGEFQYTRRFFRNRNGSANANLTYEFNDAHSFSLNNVYNIFSRKGRNEVEPSAADDYPSENFKNILGGAYKFQNEKLSSTAFFKHYTNQVNEYADPTASGNFQKYSKNTSHVGYGTSAAYFLTENLQAKASYEKAYRIPTGRELFGAGNDFQIGNPDLKPESSDNLNAGLNYFLQMDENNSFTIDGSLIYRDIKDFIRRGVNADGIQQSINEASVKNRGVDLELRYSYKNNFTAGTSFTYQNLRNKLKYEAGKSVVSTIYNDRIPNMPYFYGNGDFSFFFNDLWNADDSFTVSYNLLYVHEFSYSYESYGGRSIPSQVAHDIFFDYGLKNNKYNLSLECRNIFDENLYDNFSLQKPGRSFGVKFRYFLNK